MITNLIDKLKGTYGNRTGMNRVLSAKAIYSFGLDGGVIGTITPKQNVLIPLNAVIVGATINSTTALASAASNIRIGTSAGSAIDSILTATNKTSFSTNAKINGIPTFAAPVKMSDKGYVTLDTSGTLTAGVVEITVYYYVARS